MEQLRNALSFGSILPPERIEYILTHFREKNLKTNEDFLSQGSVSHEIGFVNHGIIRVYALRKDGEEVTKYFVRQNQFVVDLESYYTLKPSESALQAVVDTQIFAIRREVWERLSEEIPKLYILTKSLTEATLLNKIKDNDFLNFGTALEKYQEFLRQYPDLAQQVPLQHIASYLKITPQSLSRIRKNLMSNQ
ncbi:MAG: Crp/Fnr family transcriptional regulator [Cyclobacteriaceae bacterium]